MSEKVKVTKEQAEVIEEMKKTGIPVTWESNGWYVKRDRRLNNFHFKKFIHAICNGYELHSFEVGDWVVSKLSGEVWQVDGIEQITINKNESERIIADGIVNYPESLRHATNREIAAEKERRTDEKLDNIIQDLSTEERDQLYNKLMMMDVSE